MTTKKNVITAFFLAVAIILPFFIGQIPQFGKMLSPMHLPILLTGFICGWPYGIIIGLIAPLLRSLIFGMPTLPTAIAMAFELATYGFVAGYMYSKVKNNIFMIYATLITSIIAGKIVWGIARFCLVQILGIKFSLSIFFYVGFIMGAPGIILQLLIIPLILTKLQKYNLISLDNNPREGLKNG